MEKNSVNGGRRPVIHPPDWYRTDRVEDESWRTTPAKPTCIIRSVVRTKCCGWLVQPTRVEVIEAVRGRDREDLLKMTHADVVAIETDPEDLRRMLEEGLFSAADAAWWMQPGAEMDSERAKVLNEWLKPERMPNG